MSAVGLASRLHFGSECCELDLERGALRVRGGPQAEEGLPRKGRVGILARLDQRLMPPLETRQLGDDLV
jgi:hypothetical protein